MNGFLKTAIARWRKEFDPKFIEAINEAKIHPDQVPKIMFDLRKQRGIPKGYEEHMMLGEKLKPAEVSMKAKPGVGFKKLEERIRQLQTPSSFAGKVETSLPKTPKKPSIKMPKEVKRFVPKSPFERAVSGTNTLKILGGLAALAALGYGASELYGRRQQAKHKQPY